MPKLVCGCENVIDLSRIPTPEEWSYLKANRWDDIVEAVVAAVRDVDRTDLVRMREVVSDACIGFSSAFYRCAECGRLIFSDASHGLAVQYIPACSDSD